FSRWRSASSHWKRRRSEAHAVGCPPGRGLVDGRVRYPRGGPAEPHLHGGVALGEDHRGGRGLRRLDGSGRRRRMMTDKTLTYERAKELLLQVIEGREDYVYENPNPGPVHQDACYNHWKGKPSCLIGHAIAADGIDLVEKVAADADAAGAVQSTYGQWDEN